MALVTTDYLKPISFLVIDDKSYMRRLLKGVLETLGAKMIDECDNTKDALNIVRNVAPDVVLTEFWLNPLNGVEFLPRHPQRQRPDPFHTDHYGDR